MTTVAQVKQAVQPLLQRNPDLALVGRLVVVKPLHHIHRGIYIDRSGDPGLFVPTWAVNPLFEPGATFGYTWGDRIYRPRPDRRPWDVNDPAISTILCEQIEQVALPLLRPVQSIDDFVAFASKERFQTQYLDLFPSRKIYVDIARGDFDSAREAYEFLAARGGDPLGPKAFDRMTKTLFPLIAAKDRPALAQMLREFELAGVKRDKLEKCWEPTPFPLELQSS